MKIAVYHSLPQGGARRVMSEQIKGLSRRHKIHLFRIKEDTKKNYNLDKYCEKIIEFKFKYKSSLPYFFKRLSRDYKSFIGLNYLNKTIANKINDGNFDIALVFTDKLIEAPFILRYLKIPNLYYDQEILARVYSKAFSFAEDVSWLKTKYELYTREIMRKIDFNNSSAAKNISTNSYFMKQHIKKVYTKNASVCYPGVNTEVFRKVVNNNKNNILYLGNTDKYSGFDLAKDMLKVIGNQIKIKIEIVSGNDIGDDKTLAKYYSFALLTICPSKIEAFGLKALESMACETPVLAVNEGGYRETVIDGVTGYLLPRDPKAFAEKIIYLYNHPEVVRRMGKAGREHVKKNFTWKKHVDCIEKQLIKIAKSGKNN
ncbi:MAG: Glycosyl transferase group 1 [Microgenomates group bacterium GW2011_GWC1_37_8]|uniref:Glycosyl transferase group 1 n=1 Tax=Candidatus Woesebacteria bacterium GW2011_GWB1_38_8 TaxID=1618570 RepID=A0A0G0L1D6_9BACT|nr:MAG: Glycosyl transferase group 1 [Microgenomates group bacterium GW2011_GWC1_37_8]KKQ85768.1 MAG: Glycosyl transferase group 1 [Candidatus Woesebacteria bacterium GW2011_GWB1_38_8]